MNKSTQPDAGLRLAFLGGSLRSAVGRAHFVSAQMDKRFRLVAGCFSRNEEENRETAKEYGVSETRIHDSLEKLIENEAKNIDAIVILTPQDQHFEHVLQCISAKIPVICEKSLVSSVREVSDINERLTQENAFLRVTYNYTGYPMVREMKHIIQSGALGGVQQVIVEMPQEGFLRKTEDGSPMKPQDWRLKDGSIPTLSLDLGVHIHHLIDFLTGQKPIKVISSGQTYGNFPGIMDNLSVLASYTNGMSATIWYSKTALGYRNGLRIRIFCEAGAVEWIHETPEALMMNTNKGERLLLDRGSRNISIANNARYTRFKVGHPAGYIEAFANYYHDLADDLKHYLEHQESKESKYTFGIQESIESMKFLEAISQSACSSSWEPVT